MRRHGIILSRSSRTTAGDIADRAEKAVEYERKIASGQRLFEETPKTRCRGCNTEMVTSETTRLGWYTYVLRPGRTLSFCPGCMAKWKRRK